MDNAGNGHLRWIRLLTEFKCASDTAETHLNHFKRYIEQLERILTEIAASTKVCLIAIVDTNFPHND
jgi:hypothetical protein